MIGDRPKPAMEIEVLNPYSEEALKKQVFEDLNGLLLEQRELKKEAKTELAKPKAKGKPKAKAAVKAKAAPKAKASPKARAKGKAKAKASGKAAAKVPSLELDHVRNFFWYR